MSVVKQSEVAIIIPVYNEEAVVAGVIREVQKTFPTVVCVEDGSRDNSVKEIEKTSAYLVKHPINMGQGAALQTGIEFARALPGINHFVTFDADGQHRVVDVQKMLKTLQQKKLDIVLGSRWLESKNVANMPWLKRQLFHAAIAFSNFTSGVRLTDTHNGLRAFNRHVAENMQITMSDMAHASEILEIIRKKKFKYAEVPVEIMYTDYSNTKGQSVLNAINVAFDILLTRIAR